MKNTIFKDVPSHIQAPRGNAQFSRASGVVNDVADKRYPGQDSLFRAQVIVNSPTSNLSEVKSNVIYKASIQVVSWRFTWRVGIEHAPSLLII